MVQVEFVDNCGVSQCGNNSSPYRWFLIDHITANHGELWGPEPYLYLNRTSSTGAKCHELSFDRPLIKPFAVSKKWTLAQSLDYTLEDVSSLYSEYLQHCYPSLLLNQFMLVDYMSRSKVRLSVNSKVHSPARLYQAFCLSNGLYVSFKDLLHNLLALDRRCVHGGVGGELRTRCIFRYYASVGATSITLSEMVTLYEDIILNNNLKCNDIKKIYPISNAQQAAEDLFQMVDRRDFLTMDMFIELVGTLKIRGTACIYRSTEGSPLTEIRTKRCYDTLVAGRVQMEQLEASKAGNKMKNNPKQAAAFVPAKRNKRCTRCARQNYSMAIHSALLTITSPADYVQLASHQQELPSEYTTRLARPLRDRSLELINPLNLYNEIRIILRRFSTNKCGIPRAANSSFAGALPKWEIREDRLNLVDKVLRICLHAKEHFRTEARVLRCSSPVYVLGDIHGNLDDLMVYDHLLWRSFPSTGSVCSALFLGDYVDRGSCSVECVLYLFCMKMLLPERVHLLRGNHEMRPVQQQFTFFRECLDKFGVACGTTVWEAFNQVFDCMPLCALLDEHIFAAHGGIPASSTRLEIVSQTIPVTLPNPMLVRIAWEMLWNDPLSRAEYREFMTICATQECFPLYPAGYLPNIKRGTAFYYSEDAVDYFLEQNGLSLVIRAHEVVQLGFLFSMDGKVITVFNSSKYCGGSNESAMVHLDSSGKVRVLRVETDLTKFN